MSSCVGRPTMQKPYSSFLSSMIKVPFLTLLFFTIALSVSAQSDLGRISGFVRDSSGGTVANAKITARNQSGVERQATSNETGYYVISNVPPGFYTVIVEASGFQ